MEYYESIKAFHLIFIIIWISTLVYLPRLLMFHQEAIQDQNHALIQKLQREETLLYRYVMSLSFMIAFGLGITLITLNSGLFASGWWLYLKFFFLSILGTIHHICLVYMKELQEEKLIAVLKLKALPIATLFFISLLVFVTLTKMF